MTTQIRTYALILLFVSSNLMAQKDGRILAWELGISENGNYDSAWAVAERTCMESTHFFLAWSDLQPDTATFDASIISGYLDILNLYLPFKGMPIELVVAPINTIKREVPDELESVPFNDPKMIRYFRKALDTILYHLRDVDIRALNIGNECDGYLGTNPIAYAQYKVFLDSVIPYAKSLYQNYRGKPLKVGTTLMHGGLTDAIRGPLCKTLNAGLDVVSVTYYPLNPDFTMKSPNVVDADFDTIVSLYPDTSQPIYFVECGYSSSPVCNSSEALQAAFYEAVFASWDEHRDNIKYVSVFKLTDWSLEQCQELSSYYGIKDTVFIEYLHGLGVREWFGDGIDKEAMYSIRCELAARSWCNVQCIPGGIEEEIRSEIKVYPNPTLGHVWLEVNEIREHLTFEVYNLSGQIVYPQQSINEFKTLIELPEQSGLYMIKVSGKLGDRIYKILRD